LYLLGSLLGFLLAVVRWAVSSRATAWRVPALRTSLKILFLFPRRLGLASQRRVNVAVFLPSLGEERLSGVGEEANV